MDKFYAPHLRGVTLQKPIVYTNIRACLAQNSYRACYATITYSNWDVLRKGLVKLTLSKGVIKACLNSIVDGISFHGGHLDNWLQYDAVQTKEGLVFAKCGRLQSPQCKQTQYTFPAHTTNPALITSEYLQHYEDDQLHCKDGPAHVALEGDQWYFNGIPHREDGPAYWFRNVRAYLQRGKFYCQDGPAVIVDGKADLYFTDNELQKVELKSDSDWEVNLPFADGSLITITCHSCMVSFVRKF